MLFGRGLLDNFIKLFIEILADKLRATVTMVTIYTEKVSLFY